MISAKGTQGCREEPRPPRRYVPSRTLSSEMSLLSVVSFPHEATITRGAPVLSRTCKQIRTPSSPLRLPSGSHSLNATPPVLGAFRAPGPHATRRARLTCSGLGSQRVSSPGQPLSSLFSLVPYGDVYNCAHMSSRFPVVYAGFIDHVARPERTVFFTESAGRGQGQTQPLWESQSLCGRGCSR